MATEPKPVYTPDNTTAAYCLRWSLTLFWKSIAPLPVIWWPEFQSATSGGGTRLWQHFQKSDQVSQFLISSLPPVSPSSIIRRIKGRLQTAIREILPDAFQRNYYMVSLGKAKSSVIEHYVGNQLKHHRMASAAQQLKLQKYQYRNSKITLPTQQRSSYGLYSYNLHLVLVYRNRYVELNERKLSQTLQTIKNTSHRKKHILSRVGMFADHIHLTLAPHISESPATVTLSYMNNLALVFRQIPVFEFRYYVGTFGSYDLGAVYNHLRT